MLIVAITVFTLLFGGGIFSLDNVRDTAKEAIQDEDRAKQMIVITMQADKEFKSFTKNVNNLSKQLVQMNKDYNLTREEIDSFYFQADKRRMAFLDKFVEFRFQAKNLVTAEEWQAMYAKIRK